MKDKIRKKKLIKNKIEFELTKYFYHIKKIKLYT